MTDDQLPLFDAEDRGSTTEDRDCRGPRPSTLDESAVDPDAAAREFARDPDHHVVLEASAGTGKTSVLVTRYVNLLMRGVDPANILAITFTRKAAAEMRERIIRELRRAAEQSTFDRGRWAAIRDRLGDIQISTIDAFCLSLLREFPLEADLDPGFAMADETEVPRLVDQSLDTSLATFIGLAKREPDLALVLAQLGLTRTREGLAYLLQRRLVAWDVLDRFLARGPADLDADDVCGRAVESMVDLFGAVSGGLDAFLAEGPTLQPRYQLLAQDLRRLESFRTAGNAAVRGLINRVERHALKADGTPRASDRIHPYKNTDYPNLEAGKRHRAEALRLGRPVEEMVRRFNRDLNVVLARGVRRMFAIALAHYRTALNERSLLDFSDVLQRAVDLLARMDEFSQSRYRLEGRYHHVLVDEFQDTSRKQWELISLLVTSWGEGLGLATRPSIFIVGDRKQSIYRFRDAEVAVLKEAGAFIDALRPGSTARRSIARSFRAVPELLAFVNDLFDEMGRHARRPDDFKYDADDRFPIDDAPPAPPPAAPGGTPGTVSERATVGDDGPTLGLVTGADSDACAGAVAAEIARILREETVRDRRTGIARAATPGDVGILFRSRASHREFESALGAAGIPAYVYKGLGFFDADEIKDLAALIRFLANPSSDLRAAAFLRSRFVRLSDTALAKLAPALAAALTAPLPPAAMPSLADDDRAALAQARRHVPRWLAQVDRVPPADLIEQLIPDTAYAYELRGGRRQQAWENLKKMRGLIRRIQNRGYATLARIADHLESLTAGDESNAALEALDAVNLMTVHAAKGLEFPIVFVVNLAKGASGFPRPVRVSGEEVSVGPFVSESDDEERFRDREETKRLMYVALTRARDRLYLGTVLKEGALAMGRGSLADVLPESVWALFARAGQEPGERVDWTAPSGRVHQFRLCRDCPAVLPPASLASAFGRMQTPVDDFPPLTDPAAIERVPVTEALAETAAVWRPPGQPEDGGGRHGPAAAPRLPPSGEPCEAQDDALMGTLVHRLFQFAAELPASATGPQAADFAARLIRPEERATAVDIDAIVTRAIAVWAAMKTQPGVVELLESGTRLHELPFSCVAPGEPGRVLRGTIDCLVYRPDGSIAVIEFKTGSPLPSHQAQLDIYLWAARALFPGAVATGSILYPR